MGSFFPGYAFASIVAKIFQCTPIARTSSRETLRTCINLVAVPMQSPSRHSSESFSVVSTYSVVNGNERRVIFLNQMLVGTGFLYCRNCQRRDGKQMARNLGAHQRDCFGDKFPVLWSTDESCNTIAGDRRWWASDAYFSGMHRLSTIYGPHNAS